jgi:hypothetical protein
MHDGLQQRQRKRCPRLLPGVVWVVAIGVSMVLVIAAMMFWSGGRGCFVFGVCDDVK